ncbi:MAG: M48 family metalloprotease [Ramlibacter sp.]|nr:M48 family metalloprotease [Ramlibacter sp.]
MNDPILTNLNNPPLARRGFLASACKHCLGLGALASGVGALAQDAAPSSTLTPSSTFKMPGRFSRPAIDTEEGGLWSMMDREETKLRRSPLAIKDAALTKYLTDLTCRLTDGHCPDIRVHVMRMPMFNATMAPNGMMQIWSGLLLRVENEAQLAAIVGHEMGHYLERHQLEQLRDAKDKAMLAQIVGLVGGVAGAVGRIGIMASMFAFSREHEARADQMGMRLMKQAGYDGRQAAAVWDNLLGELKVTGGDEVGQRNAMFATHPPVGTRRDDLLKLAGDSGGNLGAAEFQKVIEPMRFGWLQDEIRRGQFEESVVLFDRLIQRNPQDAQVLYARGEVYRQRAEKDDLARSMDDLQKAVSLSPERTPVETHRSLGLLHKQRMDSPAAVQAFEKYLSLLPDAPDGGMVKSYLTELKP